VRVQFLATTIFDQGGDLCALLAHEGRVGRDARRVKADIATVARSKRSSPATLMRCRAVSFRIGGVAYSLRKR
jgi:hypothetical protein